MYHYLAVSAVFLLLSSQDIQAQNELRCYQCKNCPGPIKEREVDIIKCHEGNALTSTTESESDLTTESETTEYESYFNDERDDGVEEETRFDLSHEDYDDYETRGDENGYVCYTIVVEDSVGVVTTNRGCAIKLEQENETCALANNNLESDPVSCQICEEEICNRGNVSTPSILYLLRALTPIFIIFLLML